MAMLVPLSRIKKRLGIALNECKHDRALLDIYSASLVLLEQELGEPITQGNKTYYFTGGGCCEYNLPYRQINSIVSVSERGEVGESNVLIDSADYDLYQYSGGYLLRRKNSSGSWECGKSYVAVFNMGYSSLPTSLGEAIVEQVREFVVNSNLPEIGRGRNGVVRHVEVVEQTEEDDSGAYSIGRVEMSEVCSFAQKLIQNHKKVTYWGM